MPAARLRNIRENWLRGVCVCVCMRTCVAHTYARTGLCVCVCVCVRCSVCTCIGCKHMHCAGVFVTTGDKGKVESLLEQFEEGIYHPFSSDEDSASEPPVKRRCEGFFLLVCL